MSATGAILGFLSDSSSYCSRSGCSRRSQSAVCSEVMARTIGWANVRYRARLISDTRAAAAKRRSSAASLPPRARISSRVRALQRMIHSPVTSSGLPVSLTRNPGRHEDSEMTGGLVNGVDDRLAVSADVVDVVIQVENPSERLLRRCDVVALGTEHDDGRTDVAQVDHRPIRGLDHSRREFVADEEVVDDGLDFTTVQVDVSAPPALEPEIALGLGVNIGVKVVLLGPQRVGGILVLEILHQPGAVEFATAEIASKSGEPAAAEQAARIAHRVLAMHTAPIG